MSQARYVHLAQLTEFVLELDEKRMVCDELSRLIMTIRKSGIVVIGESNLLYELEIMLNEARNALLEIKQAANTQTTMKLLSKLDDIFNDVKWELADLILNDLREKNDLMQENILLYEDQILEWQSNTTNLMRLLADAKDAQAPVIKEKREVERLQALVKQAERAFSEERYENLIEILSQLDQSKDIPNKFSDQISEKIKTHKDYAKQADLLLLRSPSVDPFYEYTILLRTPSEPGTHGINIQDSSTIVKQDRLGMSDSIDLVTRAVNEGLARQFSIRHPGIRLETEESFRDAEYHYPREDDKDQTSQNISSMLQKIGDLMYRLFMPEQMQRYLIDTPCSITITANDLELPWELMSYDGKFLCLERPVARMPMGHAFPRRNRQFIRSSNKLRFLLIYSDPTSNLPSAKREIELINDQLTKEWEQIIEVDMLNREEANGRKLNDVLRGGMYDVIHYAGHASFDEKNPDRSGILLFNDEIFFAQKIRRLIEGRPLVFLNACQTGRIANEEKPQMIEKYLQEPAEGLASSVIYGGALGCIGSLWPIYDRPAAEFAVHFYTKVLEGCMIGEAMRFARVQIYEKYPDQITWAAFVLYGNPTFRLVE